MKNIFLNLKFNTQKNYKNFIITYHFYQKERKLKEQKNLLLINMIKINIRNLKQILICGLILKKVHRVIKFNQNDIVKTLY